MSNSDDDQTEPKSVYSEGNENNQVVTEAIVHRDAMFASAAVRAEGGANATSAETPVIGAAAATPKASSSDKVAKSSNVNPMKKKSSQAQLKERLSNMRDGISKKAREVTERLSAISPGKKGTRSGANNDRDNWNLNILKLFIILNPLMYTPMCFYLKEVKMMEMQSMNLHMISKICQMKQNLQIPKKGTKMKYYQKNPKYLPSRATVPTHPPPSSSPPPSPPQTTKI